MVGFRGHFVALAGSSSSASNQFALGVAAPADDLVIDEVLDVVDDGGQQVGNAGAAAAHDDSPSGRITFLRDA
jgi:hypothetical protein